MPVNPIGRTERVVDDQDRATEKLSLFTEEVARLIAANEAALADDVLLKAQNLADLASASTARTNLGLGAAATVNYQSATVTLGGNLSGIDCKCVRIGDSVTLTVLGPITHSSLSAPGSAIGDIPSAYRPVGLNESNTITAIDGAIADLISTTDGRIVIRYVDASLALVARTFLGTSPGNRNASISYNV